MNLREAQLLLELNFQAASWWVYLSGTWLSYELRRWSWGLGKCRKLEFTGQSTGDERVAQRTLEICKGFHLSLLLSGGQHLLVSKLLEARRDYPNGWNSQTRTVFLPPTWVETLCNSRGQWPFQRVALYQQSRVRLKYRQHLKANHERIQCVSQVLNCIE